MKSNKTLNWAVGIYVALAGFGYPTIANEIPGLEPFFALAAIALLTWQGIRCYGRITSCTHETLLPYERLEGGDYWRLFLTLWAAHTPLASRHVWGFYLLTVLNIPLFLLLCVIIVVEVYKNRTTTGLVLGCTVFAYAVLLWQKSEYVAHYGVPIMGHFLEKPEYDAKYRVEVEPENSNRKLKAIADIHVERRTESYDEGESTWGVPIIRSYKYRDVWVRRIYFPSGGSVPIEVQFGPLRIEDQFGPPYPGKSVFVLDHRGNGWHVTLTAEPIY
jgi:hypothetical protein